MFSVVDARKDHEVLATVLMKVGEYLPLDFIVVIFQHMRDKQRGGYDHLYLLNAVTVLEELLLNHVLEEHDLRLAFAIVLLMETGHGYSEEHPYEVSNGLAYKFLKDHTGELFSRNDKRFIARHCRPVYPHSLKPTERTSIILLTHNVRRLVPVIYPNIEKAISEFVKANTSKTTLEGFTPIDVTKWVDDMTDKFKDYYGHQGALWGTLSSGPKVTYGKEVLSYQLMAENTSLIKKLIHQNVEHLFS